MMTMRSANRIVVTALVAASLALPLLVWAACADKDPYASNNLSPCRNCHTGASKNEEQTCVYDVEAYGNKIFCDCGEAHNCGEALGDEVNVKIEHHVGICVNGLCVGPKVATEITTRQLALWSPCMS
jgi:hypothetical protein